MGIVKKVILAKIQTKPSALVVVEPALVDPMEIVEKPNAPNKAAIVLLLCQFVIQAHVKAPLRSSQEEPVTPKPMLVLPKGVNLQRIVEKRTVCKMVPSANCARLSALRLPKPVMQA